MPTTRDVVATKRRPLLTFAGGRSDRPAALLRAVLPSGAFAAWRGLWLDDRLIGPIGIGAVACAVLTVVCVGAAAFVFLRRDVEIR